jgi:DNA-binding response OmpR family regulator
VIVSKQVLIVDDDADILKLVRRYCEKLGCAVREAGTAAEARAALQGFTPDLVCLDLMLPDGSGYAICEQIRADPRLSEVPVLIMSARSSPVDRAAAEEAGANDYLIKPLRWRSFADTAERLLAGDQPQTG